VKRICLILLVLFSSLSFSHAQDEDIDDEFFEDEPIIDPLDEPISPPPTWEADDSSNQSPRPGSFPRPSGGGLNSGGGGNYTSSGGVVEFRLVDPPAFKKVKPPLRIPPRVRKQVEENVKRSTQNQ
jgi:hypothetical protein